MYTLSQKIQTSNTFCRIYSRLNTRELLREPKKWRNTIVTTQSFSENNDYRAKDVTYPTSFQRISVDSNVLEQLKAPPNLITIGRIASCPFLSYLIVTNQFEPAVAICILAGISDYMDGYMARNYNMGTVLGSYLDPLADKVLVNSVAVSLCYVDPTLFPSPLLALWLTKDLATIGGTALFVMSNTTSVTTINGEASDCPSLMSQLHSVQPTLISKFNTALQFTTLSIAMALPVARGLGVDPFVWSHGNSLLECLWWLTGATTIGSLYSYRRYSAFDRNPTPDDRMTLGS